LLGGIAIFVAFNGTLLLFAPLSTEVLGLLAAGGVIFLLGLVDDLKPLRPSVKLAGQIAGACLLIPFGIHAIFVVHPLIAVPATLFWVVAISNAFNLLDNMDGLSAGVAFISACFLCLISMHQGQPALATASAALAGAALGFLLFNFSPARVFMGDSGSLFLGFTLGSLSIMGTWHEASNLFLILLVPLLVLAVPLFDTTLVTVLRKLAGRAISQGGRDHSSHRLVALGLSERHAVLLLYAVCTAFGGLAILGLWFDLYVVALAIGLFLVLILFFGVFLAEAKVYGELRLARQALRDQSTLLGRVWSQKWLIFGISTDLVLVGLAYLAAYLIRFEGDVPDELLRQIHELLPIVLPIQIAALVFFGVYQEEWRYAGLQANLKIVKATLVGGALSYGAVKLLTEFTFYSRAVFAISTLLTTLLLLGSRSVLRIFREWFATRSAGGHRVLVVGAGDAGERVVSEMRRHPLLGLHPVGLVDDDPAKRGLRVHGVRVLATCDQIPEAVRQSGAEEIIFAIPSADAAVRRRILDACARAGIPCRVALGAREIVGRGGEGLARPVQIQDLLLRSRLRLEERSLREALRGRSLLILGVGSFAALKLARWARELGAARVTLADSDATLLATRLAALGAGEGAEGAQARLVHPPDEGSMARVLRDTRPDVVVFAGTVRTEAETALDPAGVLEQNFLSVCQAARQSAAAGARTFVLWSTEPPAGPTRSSLRLGELGAAAVGPPRVVVLRFPAIAEDPLSPIGEMLHRAARGERLPLFSPAERVRLALAEEVAGLTLQAMGGEMGSEVLQLRVSDEPLATLLQTTMRQMGAIAPADGGQGARPGGPQTDASSSPESALPGAPEARVPGIDTAPLIRPAAAKVEAVERQVREALRAGRPHDAWAATSLLLPSFPGEGDGEAGAVVALDPVRRKTT
jgi:UDP-GlcNAc:undecaprenyl-phosphate GlcNAc-1-phosphate transferase